MPSKYASIKFAVLTTPLFVLVPLTAILVDVFSVSSKDLVFLFVSGLMFGMFYMFVAYLGSKRKITKLKFIAPIFALSFLLAVLMERIVTLAVKYDNILVIVWTFTLAIATGCIYGILRMIKESKHNNQCVYTVK